MPSTEQDIDAGIELGRRVFAFAKRARSILWQKNKDEFYQWQARVSELQATEGGGLKKPKAIVQASRDFPCLVLLFSEYGIDGSKPTRNPPSIESIDSPPEEEEGRDSSIVCENIEQTYRENLRWAIDAAGERHRSKREPTTCPNNAAYYLYRQAMEDSRDFLAKMAQAESKPDAAADDLLNARKASKRSIDEINGLLEMLEPKEERRDEGSQEGIVSGVSR